MSPSPTFNAARLVNTASTADVAPTPNANTHGRCVIGLVAALTPNAASVPWQNALTVRSPRSTQKLATATGQEVFGAFGTT